jgi:Concanavalin A-like lectin/glucanases superfamily
MAADSADGAAGILSGGATWVAGVDEPFAVSVGNSTFTSSGGSSSGGRVAFPTQLPAAFTLTFWAKANGYGNVIAGTTPDNNVIFGGETYSSNGFRSGFTPSGVFSFWTTESGGTLFLADTSALPVGTWAMYAVTYSSGLGRLYRNGSLVATSSGQYVTGTTNMGLDTDVGGVHFYWGSVDDTRVYNSALSASAIAALY